MTQCNVVPFVSVIVPVYNDPIGISNLLSFLAVQTYASDSFEVIVCDNGSSDNTREIVIDNLHKIRNLSLVVEKDIQSSYAARNKALKKSTGEIIAFTDSDCLPSPCWIENGVKSILVGADLVGGHITVTIEKESNIWSYLDSSRKLNQRSYVEDASFAATANLFVRKEKIITHGDFNSGLISGGDYEFGRRLVSNGCKLVYCRNSEIKHPARSSFAEILKKTKRVAKGQKELEKLGLLEHAKLLSFNSLKPVLKISQDSNLKVSPLVYFGSLIMANFFKYYNLILRIR
tara:strand:- start:36 stop:902 length:867 start_codon:yes stop_codon:yes gene_type:complete